MGETDLSKEEYSNIIDFSLALNNITSDFFTNFSDLISEYFEFDEVVFGLVSFNQNGKFIVNKLCDARGFFDALDTYKENIKDHDFVLKYINEAKANDRINEMIDMKNLDQFRKKDKKTYQQFIEQYGFIDQCTIYTAESPTIVVTFLNSKKRGLFTEKQKELMKLIGIILQKSYTNYCEKIRERNLSFMINETAKTLDDAVLIMNSCEEVVFYSHKYIDRLLEMTGVCSEFNLFNLTSNFFQKEFGFDLSEVKGKKTLRYNQYELQLNRKRISIDYLFYSFIEIRIVDIKSKTATITCVIREQQEKFVKKYDLTKRESEIFTFMVRGQSYDEIAQKMKISSSTVKTHARNILKKTSVSRRAELLSLIIRESEI